MGDEGRFTSRTMNRVWLAGGILLATVLGTAWNAKHGPVTESRVMAAAGIAALGTLLCAAVGARAIAYPRWAYWTGAAIVVLAVLASPFTAASPAQWVEHTRDSLWLFPWFFTILWVLPAPAKGACAPARPYSGWLLIGACVVLGTMLQLSTRLRLS